jgi:hypothetical protein
VRENFKSVDKEKECSMMCIEECIKVIEGVRMFAKIEKC